MILCCGDALIDMIPATTAQATPGFTPLPGGAVFNTAISLGRLGIPVEMLTGMSQDLFGAQLTRTLTDSNVGTRFNIVNTRPTTLAFVELTDGHATYTFYDENSAGRMITPTDLPDLTPDITTLYFGGISLCNTPAADTYLALAEREATKRVIMLDPNIRPGFITDEAPYRTRLKAIFAVADIIKVSDEDLEWLIPGPEDVMSKLAILQAGRQTAMILTCGKDGARALLPDGTDIAVSVPPAVVVDTVGAGDTFNAGVLASLHGEYNLNKASIAQLRAAQMTKALEFGAKVAAVTVTRAGANPPWHHEIFSA